MSTTIKSDTPVSIFVLGAVVMGVFALYTTFEPDLKQIEVNASEIRSNRDDLNELKITQKAIFEHMIEVTNSLSRIEGRLDATISQGRPQNRR